MIKTLIMLAILIAVSLQLVADCDMAAMIAKDGYTISDLTNNGDNYDYNDPYDFFQFLKDRSNNNSAKVNDDGYGILYYTDSGFLPTQAWYQVDGDCSVNGDPYDTHYPYETYYCEYTYDQDWHNSWQLELDTAESTIMDPSTDAIIVMGHDRQGTGGSGNHPFRIGYNTQTFTFMQNGGLEDGDGDSNAPIIKEILLNELNNSGWFDNNAHSSNWEGDPTDVETWIDSEIFFHWIMKNIDDNDGHIVEGIHSALTTTVFDNGNAVNLADVFSDPYASRSEWVNCINFVLSDGNNLYVFKNAETYDSQHTLFLQTGLNDFYSVNTYIDPDPNSNTELDQFDFVVISRDEAPVIYQDFLNIDIKTFTSGVTWTSYPRLTQQGTSSGEIFEQAYYEYGDTGILQETYQGDPTINEFVRIYGYRFGFDIDIQYYEVTRLKLPKVQFPLC